MGSQGTWTKWETEQRKLSWNNIWTSTSWQLKFLLRLIYDVLPTPTNLCKWGLEQEPNCHLCQNPGNLEHILSSCQVALTQGRYTWRHNQVLKVLAHVLETERKRKHAGQQQVQKFIKFVKSGDKPDNRKGRPQKLGVLASADDWELRADIGGKLTFPEIVETTLRPDIVLFSRSKEKLVLVELTVPWETRCEEAHERKFVKYEDLLEECNQKGWQTWNLPVEVGGRGFPAKSCWKALSVLGITGTTRKQAVNNMGKAGEKASRWLWMRRNDSSWKPTIEGRD